MLYAWENKYVSAGYHSVCVYVFAYTLKVFDGWKV